MRPAMFLLLGACAHGPSAEAPAATPSTNGRTPTELFVVRHAEKATEPPGDPTLTPDGEARALDLARLLSDVDLVGVHSTDTTRTRSTAAPTAAAHALEVQLYDAIDGLLSEVTATGGAHLIVGHSDTIASIVTSAGGDGGPPVSGTEFDRLYLVILPEQGAPTTVRLRYGP